MRQEGHSVKWIAALIASMMVSGGIYAVEFRYEEKPGELILQGDDKPWIDTVTPRYDGTKRDDTGKVFTHLFDFKGNAPITKGAGGMYSHHRGMFIGWNKVLVGDQTYDFWGMTNAYQEHVAWLSKTAASDQAVQSEKIQWCAENGTPLIEEVRILSSTVGPGDVRVFDFESTLKTLTGMIQLRGDLHHAGMQVRMDNEVSEHEKSTNYILPLDAVRGNDDRVDSARWVCCSPVIRSNRYFLVHMTPPSHPNAAPVYSIRPYARFGAFFEADLLPQTPVTVRFRIAVSKEPLDRAACEHLYTQYVESSKKPEVPVVTVKKEEGSAVVPIAPKPQVPVATAPLPARPVQPVKVKPAPPAKPAPPVIVKPAPPVKPEAPAEKVAQVPVEKTATVSHPKEASASEKPAAKTIPAAKSPTPDKQSPVAVAVANNAVAKDAVAKETTPTAEKPSATTQIKSTHVAEENGAADRALQWLKDGNARFATGKSAYPNLGLDRRKETSDKGQHPLAVIVGCSDSREPLEVIFDQGIGDIFVVRVAGNVCDTDEIGSIEYGAGHLKTPLIVVLGHTKCGAVTAVATNAEVGGSIPKLVDNIRPAVESVKASQPGLAEAALVTAAIQANVWQSVQDLLTHSKEIRELVKEGKLKVIGGIYHIDDGTVEWLGAHPKEKAFLTEEKK